MIYSWSKYLVLSFLLLHFCNKVNSQSPVERLISVGEIPSYFNKYSEFNIDSILDGKTSNSLNSVTKKFHIGSAFWVRDLLLSGKAIYGEETHKYLNELLQKILLMNQIKEKIEIIGVSSPSFNAFTSGESVIFVNIGLLARVRTEAELSFIICHELAHFLQKHSLELHLENHELNSKRKKVDYFERLFLKHSYSRSKETEADSLGNLMYLKCGYSKQYIDKTFEILNNPEVVYEKEYLDSIIDFTSFVESFDESTKKWIWIKIFKDSIQTDSLSTHPMALKRSKKVNEFNKKVTTNGLEYLMEEASFFKIKKIATNELIRLSLLEKNYLVSYYYSVLGLKLYGLEYYKISLIKSLIGLLSIKLWNGSPVYKDHKKIEFEDFFVQEGSIFKNLVLYFKLNSSEKIISEVETLLRYYLNESKGNSEFIAINNWFFNWITTNNYGELAKIKLIPVSDVVTSLNQKGKELYVDPYCFAFYNRDNFFEYDFKYNLKHRTQFIKMFLRLNASNNDKYEINTQFRYDLLNTNSINLSALINDRLREIELSSDSLSLFPTDYNELMNLNKKYCNIDSFKSLVLVTVRFKLGTSCFIYSKELNLINGSRKNYNEQSDLNFIDKKFIQKIYFK